ncbi:hypothetical protein HRQ91_08410 [Treponema parvum]|uniref:V-type proton ATPase subunit E n=1 Tax=Treponema parvum TaxID=138851 RepID=A0A975IF19_9SPIR|nr:hypothetical protein [Treponema parvum]QTQ14473.1 hypothetical protein HRQ91_08410 [Treponema parvum]
MEELRSTEILDKEIQADARKKAEKILADADREAQRILDGVATRLEGAAKEQGDLYEQKIKKFLHDTEAALPIEKGRFLASFIEDAVSSSIDSYLKTMSQEKRFELIKILFNKLKGNITGKKINALVYGFNAEYAKKYFLSVLGSDLISCKETTFEKTGQMETGGISIHEGVILESEDKSVRCRLTLEELVSEIEETQSKKLAETLFGGRLPE